MKKLTKKALEEQGSKPKLLPVIKKEIKEATQQDVDTLSAGGNLKYPYSRKINVKGTELPTRKRYGVIEDPGPVIRKKNVPGNNMNF
jgi:hypothetical protein